MSAPTEHDLLRFTPFHIIGSVQSPDTYHRHDPEIISGLSTVVKPIDRLTGSIFLETNTGKFFIWDGTTWAQPTGQINNSFTMNEGANISFGTGAGSKIGTGTTQKLSFYNATPIVQGASIVDATGGATIDAQARTAVNAVISRLEALGLIATV